MTEVDTEISCVKTYGGGEESVVLTVTNLNTGDRLVTEFSMEEFGQLITGMTMLHKSRQRQVRKRSG